MREDFVPGPLPGAPLLDLGKGSETLCTPLLLQRQKLSAYFQKASLDRLMSKDPLRPRHLVALLSGAACHETPADELLR